MDDTMKQKLISLVLITATLLSACSPPGSDPAVDPVEEALKTLEAKQQSQQEDQAPAPPTATEFGSDAQVLEPQQISGGEEEEGSSDGNSGSSGNSGGGSGNSNSTPPTETPSNIISLPLIPAFMINTNANAVDPMEFDDMWAGPHDAFKGNIYCEEGHQDMNEFGGDKWVGGDHVFVAGYLNCGITFAWGSLKDFSPGVYQFTLYATMAPDFGIIEVTIWNPDEKTIEIDLYAPEVRPSGPIDLGLYFFDENYYTTFGPTNVVFKVVGKNPDSADYFFGLDALSVTPVED
jgi:hypothetical protein